MSSPDSLHLSQSAHLILPRGGGNMSKRFEIKAKALAITNVERKLALLRDYSGSALCFQMLIVPDPGANINSDIYVPSTCIC